MAQSTFANSRGIVHTGSGGMSVVFPDVCLVPTNAGPIPIPFPNIGQASDTSLGPTTVRCDGSMPMVKGGRYRRTSGDEPGTAGGVVSGVNRGEAEFMLYSFDVKLEGKNVCRLGDVLFHNGRNVAG